MNKPSVVIPLVVLVNVLGALGQTLLKRAINGVPSGSGPWGAVGSLAQNGVFYGGALLTGAGVLTWLYVLSRADLSYATPFAGLGVVLISIASAVMLHEPVGLQRLLGTLVIAVGVVLVARS